jgi:CRP-like cAMP-binding protein
MCETLFGPGEIIYNSNERDDKLYFVIKGEVETFIEKNNH